MVDTVAVPSIAVVPPTQASVVLGVAPSGAVTNMNAGPSFEQLGGPGGAGLVVMFDGRTVEDRIAAIPEEVDAAGTADSKVATHDADAAAHPALSAFITSEADRAEVAADSSATASDVALARGRTYPTPAAGVDAGGTPVGVGVNEYFTVPSASSQDSLDLYQNVAGSPVLQVGKSIPASSAVQSLQALIKPNGTTPTQALSATDTDGWQAAEFGIDGGMETNAFRIIPTSDADGFKVLDTDGWCPLDSNDERAAPAWANKRFLLFGDSITQTGDPATGNFGTGVRPNWPLFAQTSLQMADLKNYAVSGAAFRHQGQTNWQMIDYQITQAIANGETPDVIVISAGTNDAVTTPNTAFLGSYATAMGKSTLGALDLTLTAEAMRWAFWTVKTAWPNAKCFYVNPLQRADFETSDKQPLLDLASQMAGRYSFILIDAHHESGIVKDFEVNGGAGRYLSDGLHPAPPGQILESNLVDRDIKICFNT